MNRSLLYSLVLAFLLPLVSFAQKEGPVNSRWKEIRRENGVSRQKNYKGPDADSYVSPSSIKESETIPPGSGSATTTPYRGQPYSSGQIRQGRRVPVNPGNGAGGNGTLKRDPNIATPEPLDIPESDSPDINGPDINGPDVDFTGSFWKYLLIILLLIVVAFIILQVLRNRTPKNSSIPLEALEENLNPVTIPKTELEIRLEEALSRDDFRECVRIYFLFAMRELIERRWIFWKKEKTNIHYIIEMQGKPTVHDFEKVVGIYELVWYGEYHIDKTAYLSMEPALAAYLQQLESLR